MYNTYTLGSVAEMPSLDYNFRCTSRYTDSEVQRIAPRSSSILPLTIHVFSATFTSLAVTNKAFSTGTGLWYDSFVDTVTRGAQSTVPFFLAKYKFVWMSQPEVSSSRVAANPPCAVPFQLLTPLPTSYGFPGVRAGNLFASASGRR